MKPLSRIGALFCIGGFLIAASAASAQSKPSLLCKNLGAVYGVAFAKSGDLLAAGSDGDASVIWSIDKKGAATHYIELTDPQEALSIIGISLHSKFPADMTVDEGGNLFVGTRLPAGAFVITADKVLRKIYLNMAYAISLQETDPPHGVFYDASAHRLFLVTFGPASETSTTQVTHLASLVYDGATGDYQDVFKGKKDDILFIKNAGIKLDFKPVALARAPGGAVYCVGGDSVYRAAGETMTLVKKISGVSLWGAVADPAGNLYLSANAAGYELGSGHGGGQIIRMDPKGNLKYLTKQLQEPLGLAISGGMLFVADRATGGIWTIKP